MAHEVKWLLVGPGDIARKRVAPALAGAANSRLCGVVYNTRRREAEELAAKHGATEVYGSLEEALESSGANAVYVATPVGLHAPQAVAAMESGRDVLIEKPLGLSAADCRPILAAAERTGRTAACAYYRRCCPRYRHAAEMLRGGAFGCVVLVRMDCFGWFDPQPDDPKRWRVERAKSGGGPIADVGSHMFDVLIGLLGTPVRVWARCANLLHPWDVEDTAVVAMELKDGALVGASFGWTTRTWRHDFEIVGTEAKLLWEPYDSGPVTATVGRDVTRVDLPNAENVHLPLVQDFVDALREKRAPVCPAHEAVKTNALMDAVYASSAQGREVRVGP